MSRYKCITKYKVLEVGTLMLVSTIMALSFIFDKDYQYVYVPISGGLCALLVFMVFPGIVIYLHSKPIYYDDLEHYNNAPSPSPPQVPGHSDIIKKYKKIFLWLASITSAIMVGITIEMWFMRDNLYGERAGVIGSLALIGIISGIMRVYYAATVICGKLIMSALKVLSHRELTEHIKSSSNLNSTNLNSTSTSNLNSPCVIDLDNIPIVVTDS